MVCAKNFTRMLLIYAPNDAVVTLTPMSTCSKAAAQSVFWDFKSLADLGECRQIINLH